MDISKIQEQLILGALKNNDESGIVGYASQIYYKPTNTSIEDIVSSLSSTVSNHTSSISSLTPAVNNNTDSIGKINTSLGNINTSLGDITKDLESLDTTVKLQNNSIGALESMLYSLSLEDTESVILENRGMSIQLVSNNEGNIIVAAGDAFYYAKGGGFGESDEVATLGDIPDVSGFLTTSDAANTYLKKTDASSTYITTTSATTLLNKKVDKVNGLNAADYVTVEDTRTQSFLPQDLTDKYFKLFFTDTDIPSGLAWASGFNVCGWGDTKYRRWQLASNAADGSLSSGSNTDLYFRTGHLDTWGDWQTILTSLNYTTVLGNTYATKTTVGNLSDLTTTAKSSLVAAINEAAASGGSSAPELNFYKEASNYFTFSVAEDTDLIYGSSNLLQFTSAEKGGIINLTDFNTLQIDTDGAFSISTALASVLLEDTTSGTGKVTITADSFLWGTKTVATTDAFDSYYNKTNVDSLLKNKVDVVSGKQLSTNDYTTAEKTKLAGIAEGANKYVHPSYTPISYTEMAITLGFGEGIDIPLHEVDSTGHVSSTKVLGVTLSESTATQSKAGLMSAEDKTKLDNLSFSEMLTETAYNNLTTKDSSKIYFITE